MAKVSIPFVRSANNYDTMAVSDETGLKCEDPSLAQQSAKEDCDINKILERVARGIMPDVSQRPPQYGDFTSTANDFHDAMNLVCAAQEAFDQLPAIVRARFGNDPEQLLAFLDDASNREEAVRLGLVPPLEDLSTGSPDAIQRQAGEPVGKSGKARSGYSLPLPKGFKLVPADEGDQGDE